MESVFALVDLFFVGHLPNAEHTIQTVSLTESILSIIYSIAFGISMAATAIVARRVGEKNKDEAAHSAHANNMACNWNYNNNKYSRFCFRCRYFTCIGAEQETITMGSTYTKIILLKYGDHDALSHKRNISRCRRCINGNEKFVAGKHLQHYSLSFVHSWFRACACIRIKRCCNGNSYRQRNWRMLPVVSFIQRQIQYKNTAQTFEY